MKIKILSLFVILGLVTNAQNWVEGMQDHSVNFYTVQQQFNDHWKGKDTDQKGNGYKQFKRWEYFTEQRVAPDGIRPNPGVWYNTIKTSYKTSTANNDLGTWQPIGPFDALDDAYDGIGRINTIEFHPTNANTYWIGSPSGGVWKTINNGVSWTTSSDELTNLGVSDIAVDPQRPNVLYLATGDRDGGDTYSYGLLKSTDGGDTWNTTGLSWNVTSQRRIGRVIVHPTDTNIVVVATRIGIYRSTDAGVTFTQEQIGGFNTIIVSPAAPDTMFAGTTSNGNARIYRSIDGGANWAQLTSGLPNANTRRVEIAMSHQDPNYIYAVYSDPTQALEGVYQSTDGGDTWSLKANTPNILGFGNTPGQSWYDLCISVSSTNKNQIFVGGINLWRSNNQGTTWTYIGGYQFPRVHPDMHYMKFKPGTSTLYVGHDGGISTTSNSGSSWNHISDGFNITQYYKMSTSQQRPDLVIGGSQDNSTHIMRGSVWEVPFGGDGMDCEINPLNDQYMYGSSQYGNFRRSSNYGNNFQYIGGGLPNGSGGWVTPMALDPVTPSTVYIGYTKLYKSTNNGISWAPTSTQSFTQLTEIEVSEANPSVIYIASNALLNRSTDGGVTWSNISSGISGQRTITDIAVSTTNADHLWVTKSGYSSGVKVFESLDGGQNWVNISGNLPNLPANTVEYEPGTNDGVYVGTDIGVYYKDNNLTDWVSFGKDLPNVTVVDLEIYRAGKKVRIATYGRGMWESDLYSELVGKPEVSFYSTPGASCSLGDTVKLFDESKFFPTSWKWTISPNTFQYVNGTSDTSQNPIVTFNGYGQYTVTLKASNAIGTSSKTELNYLGVGGYQLPFMEDFENESSFNNWTILNPDNGNTWALATANTGSPGGRVAKMNFYNYSSNGQKDEFISPALNFANKSSANLSFDYAYRRYNANRTDTLQVFISTDCGSSWTLIATYAEDGTGNFSTGTISQSSNFTPSGSIDWCGSPNVNCKSIDLTSYVGNYGTHIKFVAANANGNNLYLDNINVSGVSSIQPTADFISDTITCSNTTVDFYDISQDMPSSWEWTFTGGTPLTSTMQNPSISYNAPGTYPVKLKATNSIGSDSIVKTAYITIEPIKPVSISITANNSNICFGDTAEFIATAANQGPFPAYQWRLNGNNVGGNSPSLQLLNLLSTDTISCVLMSNENCASDSAVVSNSASITVLPLPSVSIPGFPSVCANDSPLPLVGGLPAGGFYSGAGVNNGVFDPSIAGNGSHWISYTYTNAAGCANTDSKSVYVFNAPVKPIVIAPITNTLKCSQNFNNYQWIDGSGNDIPGETNQTYNPTSNGIYSVRITDGNGCVNTSDSYLVGNISIEEYLRNSIKVFPNPTSGIVNISLKTTAHENCRLDMYNAIGELVYSNRLEIEQGENAFQFDVSSFSSGVYSLQITVDDIQVLKQLIKL